MDHKRGQLQRAQKPYQRADYFDGGGPRVVLTGDAAWCATPLACIGTTLATTGAYILAEKLSRAEDLGTVFAAYEKAMRPMVEQLTGHRKSFLG